jgi:hypothetical protein
MSEQRRRDTAMQIVDLEDWVKDPANMKGLLDHEGHVIPTKAALAWVERNHHDRSDPEKWHLAQTKTLLDAKKRAERQAAPKRAARRRKT